jgi:hypothetical protein
LHFAAFLALEIMVSMYIDAISTGAEDSRFNNGEAQIPIDH